MTTDLQRVTKLLAEKELFLQKVQEDYIKLQTEVLQLNRAKFELYEREVKAKEEKAEKDEKDKESKSTKKKDKKADRADNIAEKEPTEKIGAEEKA